MNGHITMIDDLPDLEDLEQQNSYTYNGPMDQQIQKYIRSSHSMNKSSGMHPEQIPSGYANSGHPRNNINNAHINNEHINNEHFNNGHNAYHNNNFNNGYLNNQTRYTEDKQFKQTDPSTYNCVDIAKHIQDCPICSRFYNNDKTVYIITIVILSIVCILLLKRVLNV